MSELYQKRVKIHPRRIDGLFQRLRVLTIFLTLTFYYVLPWLSWNGRQAILFDLPHRKFYILGITFWPQDFIMLSWLLITAAFGLFFITTLAGRLWCGYTCPQTVWTKIFMWIEYLTEGTRTQRMKLDKSKLSWRKLWRRSTKHVLWLGVAFLTAFTFVGYFTPIRELTVKVLHNVLGPWEIFWLAFFTIATYFNAGWMREQICLYVCPYGRFQGVMFDTNTMIISYDKARGEPRGSRKQGSVPQLQGLGDCVNCSLCVQVCPTGIDIRDGLQVECIGCAACIDACDSIMDKMKYPKGLVRYTTENNLANKPTKILRPRLIANGILIIVMLCAISFALFTRVPLRLDIARDRNHLYREMPAGTIQNSYLLKVINMSQQPHTYRISISGLDNLTHSIPDTITLAAEQIMDLPISVEVAPSSIQQPNSVLYFTITDINNHRNSVTTKSRFIGPRS
jgi:cytochrome c oxidase accessory protein FixG